VKPPLSQAEFQDECRRAFAYLITDYGFAEQPENRNLKEVGSQLDRRVL
jgi:hypothetical protein